MILVQFRTPGSVLPLISCLGARQPFPLPCVYPLKFELAIYLEAPAVLLMT